MKQFFVGLCLLAAQSNAAWRDPSPHQVRFVTVDTSVRLEVLDWGGTGRPILFVGCYLTAHVHDEIAPKLTDRFHVYAVTRRGIGASDRPATGYDPKRRAADVLDVIDALGMQKPILVGNSCGGAILHTLGADHPDRLGGLVYLDAAEDPTLKAADYEQIEVDRAHLPAFAGTPAPPLVFPEAEAREIKERPPDPVLRKAIVEDNNVKPEYARIRVPVLAIYRTVTMEQALKDYPPKNDQERAALNQAYAAGRAMLNKWERDLLAGVPSARIVELPGANLYMFLSNESDIIRELGAFAATLGLPRRSFQRRRAGSAASNGAPPPFARPPRAPHRASVGPQALMPPEPMAPRISYGPRRVPRLSAIESLRNFKVISSRSPSS